MRAATIGPKVEGALPKRLGHEDAVTVVSHGRWLTTCVSHFEAAGRIMGGIPGVTEHGRTSEHALVYGSICALDASGVGCAPCAHALLSSPVAAFVIASITPAALDMTVIDELRELETDRMPDFIGELIDLVRHATPLLIEAMRSASTAQDAATLRRAAHTCKGSSSNLGATALARLGRGLEEQAKTDVLANAIAW